jgi:hypothetical protein
MSKIQMIENSLRCQWTRNIKTTISIKFVEIDKALLRVSHENNRAGNYNFFAITAGPSISISSTNILKSIKNQKDKPR